MLEPFLTDQWYVDAKTLAEPAIEAVRKRKTVFVPAQWDATFFNWMENIQPWCISRQIWWGHQIPAWYGPDGKIFVAETEDDAVADALAHYTDIEEIKAEEGHDIAADPKRRARFASEYLHRDEDVLDTWFSSALWPFSTLGWPDQTPELKRFYPTSTLVTGFDIIFFWVARMMMMGLHFMKDVPFRDVYIHRLVRDASGAKMSKSKGNVVDPLGVIDQYGADALRFTLARGAAQGHDIRLGPQEVESNRNFATKLWNAARFAEINGCARDPDFDPHHAKETLNRWIIHETAKTAERGQLRRWRPSNSTTRPLRSIALSGTSTATGIWNWRSPCSPALMVAAKNETRAMAAWALDEILKLLHPFMPFVTEELWRVTGEHGPQRHHMLALDAWPVHDGLDDEGAEGEIGWVIDLITAIRSVRAEMNIPRGDRFAAGACGRLAADRQPSASLVRIHPAAGARLRDLLRRHRRRKVRCRSSCAAMSRRCRLPASSTSPPSARGSARKWQSATPISRASTRSSTMPIFSSGRPRKSWKASARSARRRWRARVRLWRRCSVSKGRREVMV